MVMTEQLARDAMVPEPLALDASASAQEAAEALSRPEVRAVFVCDDHRLTGVITRKTLVREVVARGLDPKTTPAGSFAEKLRPGECEEEDRNVTHASGEPLQEIEQAAVRPVNVLVHEQRRTVHRECFDEDAR